MQKIIQSSFLRRRIDDVLTGAVFSQYRPTQFRQTRNKSIPIVRWKQ